MNTTDANRPSDLSGGFTLAEVLVTIGLAAILMVVYGSILYTSFYVRRAQSNVQAMNFLQEELESLRTLPFTELLTRTNGRFLGLPIQRGPWVVSADATAASAPDVLTMRTAQTAVIEETGLVLLPGNYRKDFDFTAKVKILSSSPSGWGGGIVFRCRDSENQYRFRFANGGIALDKVLQGTKTSLWTQSATYNTDTWYTLRVVATGSSLALYKNGSLLTTVTDTSFTTGDLGLIALNSGQVSFDDIGVTADSVTSSWNFDADAVGSLPVAWQRMSYMDLPGGTGTLTIADYLNQSAMKQCTATVTWTDGDSTRTSTRTVLISD